MAVEDSFILPRRREPAKSSAIENDASRRLCSGPVGAVASFPSRRLPSLLSEAAAAMMAVGG